jgi:predicted component of type VI protein secretion system
MRCWLRMGGRETELKVGQTVLGRHDSCDVTLDDPLTSRRHAMIEFDGTTVLVQDLGSVNGVVVNGRRIKAAQELKTGDELRLGGQLIQLHLGPRQSEVAGRLRQGAQTLTAADSAALMKQETEDATVVRDGEALETLVMVAEKMLVVNRGADAERVLQAALRDVQERAARGRAVERATLEAAASVSVRLAEVTHKGQWISYVFTLYHSAQLVLPALVIDRLYSVVRVVDQVDMAPVRLYLARLRQLEGELGPAERFLVRRLDGFERVAEWR